MVTSTLGAASRSWLEGARAFISSPYVLRALCVSVSLAFLSVEVGKLAHDSEMRQFFLASGYPIWFLYFTMLIETIGAIGLWVDRAMLPAAVALTVMMIGAMGTHAHNHDPFTDSLEAFHLLVILLSVITIRALRRQLPAMLSNDGN